METPPIRVCLLDKPVQITIDGKPEDLNTQALSLFVYMAENGEAEYQRADLARLLYGRADARDTLRKSALFRLSKTVKQLAIETKDTNVIRFFPDRVWVDSRDFAQRASSLVRKDADFTAAEYLQARELLELYRRPFLQGFNPKPAAGTDNTRFLGWKDQRRQQLAALNRQLLEKVTPFCLKQEAWQEAQTYAQRWLASPGSGVMPLQYLIWIAANQQPDMLNFYVAQLREREERGEVLIGPSPDRWVELIRRGKAIPPSVLESRTEQSAEEVVKATGTQLLDHQDAVDELITLMTTPGENRVFALRGLPGVGKTETAHTAVDSLLRQHPNYKAVMVELPTELDWELLCNNILSQLGRSELLTLDYSQKKRRLKQLLHQPNLVVIVDEEHTSHLADVNTLNTLLELLPAARLLLVARELPRFDYYVIDLHGIDKQRTAAFFIQQVPWLSEVDAEKLEAIAKLTGGLPLLLLIIIGGLKKELTRLHSLIDHLQSETSYHDSETGVYHIYESILLWFWQYIDSREKDLLYAISLFAAGEGAQVDDLTAVLAGIIPSREQVQHKINRLLDLNLIERKREPAAAERYTLHPVVLDFIQRQAPQVRRPYIHTIEAAYIRYLLDFIAAHHEQTEQLDQHRQNIAAMFNLAIFGSDHHWADDQVVDALLLIFPYFERHSLYTTAAKLVNYVLDHFEVSSPAAQIELFYYAGKIAQVRDTYERAMSRYEHALALIDTSKITQHYGHIRQSIGILQMRNSHLDDAIVSFETAEHWAKKNDQITLLCGIWSNLAVAAFRQNRLDDALTYYKMVLEQTGDDLSSLSLNLQDVAQFAYSTLGLIYTERGEYDQAKACYERSMALARQLHLTERLGYLYLNLGVMYYQIKDYDAAHDCFVQGAVIAEQIGNVELSIHFQWNQGALASIRFAHKEAFHLLRSAIIAAQDNDLHWMKPRILIALGKAHLRSELPDAAQRDFAEAWSLPFLSVKHAAQCLYGLALSAMLREYTVGNNDVETTLDLIQPLLDALPASALSLNEIIEQLNSAHEAFQRDLDHFPHLARFCITEALKIWSASQPS